MLNRRTSLLGAGCAAFTLSLSVFVATTSVVGQTRKMPPSTASDSDTGLRPDLAFDVISIRPSNVGPDQWHFGAPWGSNHYEAIGMPLGHAILTAFFPARLQSQDRIVGAPSWVWNDKYDLVGKVAEADLPAWQKFNKGGQNPMLETMLQNALVDRCKLVVHRVPALVEGYALVVAKLGSNRRSLIESKPDDVIPDRALKMELDGRMIPIYSHDDPVLHFYRTSMASLALTLSLFGGPVEDRTGLTGKYRFDLTRLGTEGIQSSDWDLAPLGLKLIRAKIPTENIVIDHIERPSPN